jgi:hypothetical protein
MLYLFVSHYPSQDECRNERDTAWRLTNGRPTIDRIITMPPNQRVQPTPLRGPKIVPILASGFEYNALAIYRCGAADAQSVGRRPSHLYL